jgi:hypothetical protein
MTKPRTWPNEARHNRDRAAEEVAAAIHTAEDLLKRVECGEFTRHGLERDLLDILRRNLKAIRHLESAGAQTRPD